MTGKVKSLRRDMKIKKIGGVCAGLGEYFDLDISLVRMGAVILALLSGAGILLYLIAWTIIPPNTQE